MGELEKEALLKNTPFHKRALFACISGERAEGSVPSVLRDPTVTPNRGECWHNTAPIEKLHWGFDEAWKTCGPLLLYLAQTARVGRHPWGKISVKVMCITRQLQFDIDAEGKCGIKKCDKGAAGIFSWFWCPLSVFPCLPWCHSCPPERFNPETREKNRWLKYRARGKRGKEEAARPRSKTGQARTIPFSPKPPKIIRIRLWIRQCADGEHHHDLRVEQTPIIIASGFESTCRLRRGKRKGIRIMRHEIQIYSYIPPSYAWYLEFDLAKRRIFPISTCSVNTIDPCSVVNIAKVQRVPFFSSFFAPRWATSSHPLYEARRN